VCVYLQPAASVFLYECHVASEIILADLLLNGHSLLLSVLKTVMLLNNFVKTIVHSFQDSLIYTSLKNRIYMNYIIYA